MKQVGKAGVFTENGFDLKSVNNDENANYPFFALSGNG